MPVKRPIFYPLLNPQFKKSIFPFVNHAVNEIWFIRRRGGSNGITLKQQRFGPRGLRIGVAVNGAERLSRRNLVAYLFMNDNADRGIDGIFLAFAPSSENHASGSDLFGCNGGHVSSHRARHIDAVIRARKPSGIVDRADVAALQFDHLAKSFEGFAGSDDLPGEFSAGLYRL